VAAGDERNPADALDLAQGLRFADVDHGEQNQRVPTAPAIAHQHIRRVPGLAGKVSGCGVM